MKSLVFPVVLSVAATCSAHAGEVLAEIPPARAAEIEQWLPARPAGFGKPIDDRIFWKAPATIARTSGVTRQAESLLSEKFPPWSDELYLEFSKDGRRPPAETMLRARRAWLEPLVLAECLEDKGRFLPAIHNALEEYTREPTWTLPAHDGGLANFHRKHYSVDLASSAFAADLAQSLYLLGNRIKPDLRAKVADELERRIFEPVRSDLAGRKVDWWLGSKSDSVKNNWNAVCLAGVVGAARTILPDRHDRANFIAAGEHYSQYFVNSFTDDGYCEEGPGYWGYGFGNYVALREIIAHATGGKVDLFDRRKTILMALYGSRIRFPSNDVPPFEDCRDGAKIGETLVGYCDRVFGLAPQDPKGSAPPVSNLALRFITETPARTKAPSKPKDWDLRSYFDKVGVLVCRPRQNSANRLSVAIKGGGNGSHSHNDIGSFVISLDGLQPVGDPGGPHAYNDKTFGPHRYDYEILNSFGHPVPVVDDHLQVDATTVKPKIINTAFNADWDRISIDMTPAYKTPVLHRLTRTMSYSRKDAGIVGIEDHVTFAKPSSFETALVTRWDVSRKDDRTLEFSQNKRKLRVEVHAPGGFDLTSKRIEELDAPAFTRIGLKLRQPVTDATVSLVFRPVP